MNKNKDTYNDFLTDNLYLTYGFICKDKDDFINTLIPFDIQNFNKMMVEKINSGSLFDIFSRYIHRNSIKNAFVYFDNIISEFSLDVSYIDVNKISKIDNVKKLCEEVKKAKENNKKDPLLKNELFVSIYENIYGIADSYDDFDFEVDDSVKMYLREIGKIPLYRYEEITDKNGNVHVIDEERDAFIRLASAQTDEEKKCAKDDIANHNLRLVVSIAKKYMNRGLPLLDLIEFGNLGLLKSIDKFDYTKGYKFSTYSTWWIRQSVTRGLADEGRTIRIPVHMGEKLEKLRKAKIKYIETHNNEPTLKDLSELTGYPEEFIVELEKIQDPISIDKEVDSGGEYKSDNDATALLEFLTDEDDDPVETYAESIEFSNEVNEFLNILTDREKIVIKLRFGLLDGKPRTLEAVGKKLSVTRERIRQIEAKAIKKMGARYAAHEDEKNRIVVGETRKQKEIISLFNNRHTSLTAKEVNTYLVKVNCSECGKTKVYLTSSLPFLYYCPNENCVCHDRYGFKRTRKNQRKKED